ncbi:MAG TPA: HutD family protein [Rudaea sp.]|jgi:environmental stress-induced protein Ves|nr:HutD family protein [Rudaea sp.]
MSARLLRAADYRRMRWKNGGGWTTELAASASAGDGAEFDWRISIAEIESNGAFSNFPGCDRYIALLDGPGMELQFDGAEPVRLDQRLRFVRFAGEAKAFGQLLGGAVRDFNVIVRREKLRAEVLHRPLVGPMVFLPEAATTWFVYLIGGQAGLKDTAGMQIEAGESLLLQPGDSTRTRVLSGGGEVVLVKFTSA